MPDREKVIKGLECCTGYCDEETGCPYYDPDNEEAFACEEHLRRDAIALLKAQHKIDMLRQRRNGYMDKLQFVYISDPVNVVRCRDCKHYEIKDHWAYFKNVPVLAASDVPTCHRWGDGECKTSPDGYCFLGERRDDDATN